MKTYLKLSTLVGISLLLLAPARAVTLTINNGLGGAAGGEVGTIDPGTPSSLANEVVYINHLLGLGANATDSVTVAPHTWNYATTAFNFNGTVSATGALDYPDNPPLSIPAGYEFVLAKFGKVDYVWFVGGQAFDIPTGLGKGLGLSHWVAFNPQTVPDGGTTALMLGLGFVGIALAGLRLRPAKV